MSYAAYIDPTLGCRVEGCPRPFWAVSWCNAHYKRWWRRGDPMNGGRSPKRVVVTHEGLRVCNNCEVALSPIEYRKAKGGRDGLHSSCRKCEVIRATEWQNRNYSRVLQTKTEAVRRRDILKRGITADKGIGRDALRHRYGDSCCYCKQEMSFLRCPRGEYRPLHATVEHVRPLSRGGTHTWDNVRLACWQCNTRKRDKKADEWEVAQS